MQLRFFNVSPFGVTDITDTAQLNTDEDDQTTLSAAVGAGLVVILAAGLAGLAAIIYYCLVKKNRQKHGLFSTVT